jgi:hypothetical protein
MARSWVMVADSASRFLRTCGNSRWREFDQRCSTLSLCAGGGREPPGGAAPLLGVSFSRAREPYLDRFGSQTEVSSG